MAQVRVPKGLHEKIWKIVKRNKTNGKHPKTIEDYYSAAVNEKLERDKE